MEGSFRIVRRERRRRKRHHYACSWHELYLARVEVIKVLYTLSPEYHTALRQGRSDP